MNLASVFVDRLIFYWYDEKNNFKIKTMKQRFFIFHYYQAGNFDKWQIKLMDTSQHKQPKEGFETYSMAERHLMETEGKEEDGTDAGFGYINYAFVILPVYIKTKK